MSLHGSTELVRAALVGHQGPLLATAAAGNPVVAATAAALGLSRKKLSRMCLCTVVREDLVCCSGLELATFEKRGFCSRASLFFWQELLCGPAAGTCIACSCSELLSVCRTCVSCVTASVCCAVLVCYGLARAVVASACASGFAEGRLPVVVLM